MGVLCSHLIQDVRVLHRRFSNSTDNDHVLFSDIICSVFTYCSNCISETDVQLCGLCMRNCFEVGWFSCEATLMDIWTRTELIFFKAIFEGHLFSESTVRSMACILLLYVSYTTSWVEALFLKVIVYSGKCSCKGPWWPAYMLL
jgi:hypothetical protein